MIICISATNMYALDKSVLFGRNFWCKQVVVAVTFLLTTFNVVTDWLNWKQRSVLGGYNLYEVFHIFSTAFLAVAVAGTILLILKIVAIAFKYLWVPRQDNANDIDLSDPEEETAKTDAQNRKAIKGTNCLKKLNILLLVLSGLLEDFPALLLILYASSLPGCGTPTRYELGSAITMTTVVSSMLNSLWTMILLFCELRGCYGFHDALLNVLAMVKMDSLKEDNITNKFSCKKTLARAGKFLLYGFIFLLFTGNFCIGLMTMGQITRSISFVPLGSYPLSLSHSVLTGPVGPGLDAKPDGAMFVYIRMKLPGYYKVTIYNKDNTSIAESMRVNQLLNRLYIGQVEELSHLKDDTLVKAIPCSRIIPMKKIDASAFILTSPLTSNKGDNVDFSKCKIILRMKYETNSKWSDLKMIPHDALKSLTIDWGINIKNKNNCPLWVNPIGVDEFLTDRVQNDIIKYKCSSACGNDTDICDHMKYGMFHREQSDNKRTVSIAGIFLAINDLRFADSCFFPTEFKPSFEFCDESWTDVEPVEVPKKTQDTYPQFITLPTFYQWKEGDLYPVLQNNCQQLWNKNVSCCQI